MMLNISDEIIAIHKKYAPCDALYTLVLTHSLIVRDLALQLMDSKDLQIDRRLVETAALLHDIGVYPLYDSSGMLREGTHYITHGIQGEKILKELGYSEQIWRFASHHTGVGLTKQNIIDQKIPLPLKDYCAETDEELLVMYADKFHSKTAPPYFNSFEWYRNDVSKFGGDKATKFDEMASKFGIPDLQLLSQKYTFAIR